MPPQPSLPILDFREEITRAVLDRSLLILSAPTGSGKSTQVPQFFLDEIKALPGRIHVLQPRRIAARALAQRVAAETGKILGREIGYRVRFESKCTDQTRVLFQTYGVFFQQLLRQPALDGAGLIILDEFHERTLESDAVLAWCMHRRRSGLPGPRLIIMSATLAEERLRAYAPEAIFVNAPGKQYPVTVMHLPPEGRELPAAHASRAVQHLLSSGIQGGILVFMPGVSEIRQTVDRLLVPCRRAGFAVQELHGSQNLDDQYRLLSGPPDENRVIVATNVAETSLTIPGIRAVVDTGLARIAAYDPDRDLNTLYLEKISLASAAQRTGRAGRTGPGRSLRLWPAEQEKTMAASLDPEVRRLELGQIVLRCRSLLDAVRLAPADTPFLLPWPDEPDTALWKKAESVLVALGAVEQNLLTPRGRALAAMPLPPRMGAVLSLAGEKGVGPEAAAGLAYLESPDQRGSRESLDLGDWSAAFLEDSKGSPPALVSAYRQLRQYAGEKTRPGSRKDLVFCFLSAYRDRLAGRNPEERTYTLADGRPALLNLPAKAEYPPCLLALAVHETGGAGQKRQVTVPVYLPCESAWLRDWFPERITGRTVSAWDADRQRVVNEEHLLFDALVIERRPLQGRDFDRTAAADLLAEKLISGEIKLPPDEELDQFVARLRLAAKHFPEYGFPVLDAEDWKLLYHEFCRGKTGLKDLEPSGLAHCLRDYAGPERLAFLDRAFPRTRPMRSGKKGKYLYPPRGEVEFSARLGDFLGMQGEHYIGEGKVKVLYDILAPNYRTVQKTDDLTSFWNNTYPEVKKELQRRYPRHPWP
jgi:ATP-dependent helicase HrpB